MMYSGIPKAVFLAGAELRNPSLWNEYDRLKESEWLNREELLNIQINRARHFFEFVGQYSPFYKKLFKERGFLASSLSSLDEIKKIPIISKSQLITDNDSLHTNFKFKKLFLSETSGTTGSALNFKKDEKWDSINRANMYRSYDWFGVKPWDRYGYLWGYNIAKRQAAKVKMLDTIQNRFRMFSYDEASIKLFAQKLASSSYLAGYSSMIYEVAKSINELGLDRPNLKMLKGTSEMILDAYQKEAKSAFGIKIVSEYGAAETGLIAFECPTGSMHINSENVIVEVGSEGEIIVTNLASYSFPIIRYKLGDTVKLSDEPCSCGRAHPVILEVLGRKGATVHGYVRNYPALTFYYVFKNLAMQNGLALNFKAVQKDIGSVDVYVEGLIHSSHDDLIMNEFAKYFKNDLIVNLKFVQGFQHVNKKSQYFESYL